MDRYEVEVLIEHSKRLRETEARTTREKEFRELLAKAGFTISQIEVIISNERRKTQYRYREDETEREDLKNETAKSNSDAQERRSSGSDHSRPLLQPLSSRAWFERDWTVRPEKSQTQQDIFLQQPAPQSSTILTKGSFQSSAPPDAEAPEPLPYQRIRSWRYNPPVVTTKPVLKRVVYATYGDMLRDTTNKSLNPPGFITVPKASDSQGDALYHML
jgi:ParB-like chromosome segregation protein Spo0J